LLALPTSFIPLLQAKILLPCISIIIADLCAAQVSRLILNLLEANCPLDESIDSMTMESLRSCHTESNRDTEVDIPVGERVATRLSEEILEEAR